MKNIKLLSSLIATGLLLTACGDSSSSSTYSYSVNLKNITLSQPMSPMAVVYHDKNKQIFKEGQKASEALEELAESGDNSAILALFPQDAKGGNALILPSNNDSVTIEGSSKECISVTSMLVNTNDAFVGIDCIDVKTLKEGQSLTIHLPVYDAGTEKNSELATTIPGPAGGGEGFNEKRDDVDFVHIHANVITKDDGLSTSTLTQVHRWDNPAAMLTIKRIK